MVRSFRHFSARFLVAASAALCGAVPALADEAPDRIERLDPSSDWNIDFGENNCRLARTFGEGDNRHLVFFEQAGPDTDFGLTIAGPGIRQFRHIITRLGLESDEGFPQVSEMPGEVVGFGPAAIFSRISIEDENEDAEPTSPRTLPQIDLDEAATIERILYGHGGFALSFETGGMAPAFQALNVCAADFVRAWGLDPELHSNFMSMAKWRNEKKIARRIQKKYTRSALNRGEQAILRLRAIIEVDGSVSDCKNYDATLTERIDRMLAMR